MPKSTKVSLFLHKESIENFENCIKDLPEEDLETYEVARKIGMEGKIFIYATNKAIPPWKEELEQLGDIKLNDFENASNKAFVTFKHKNRFFSLVYGYGKSMLNDNSIERNFGLIVAANLVGEERIKSLNSMSIEDTIVDTQKQSIGYVNQNQLQINPLREILKSVAGSPNDETVASFITGTDSLTATRQMSIVDIKSNIEFYYETYNKTDL